MPSPANGSNTPPTAGSPRGKPGCEVLPLKVSGLIRPLRALIDTLDMQGRIPQIEVAVGDTLTVLVLRVLEVVGAEDRERLKRFAEDHAVQLWLQPEGPDSARPFWPV